MSNSKLNIVAISPGEPPKAPLKDSRPQQTRRQEAQAKYERLWHLEPERYDPFKTCWGQERIDRTLGLFNQYGKFDGAKCADLGSGWGALTLKCVDAGGSVDSVDIASQALERIKDKSPKIRTFQDYVPFTILKDDDYDVVIATDLVGEMPQQEWRLFFSELARLVKKEGFILCSTPLDIYSIDAFDRFRSLAETEFDILDGRFSYHYLWIKMGNMLGGPAKFGRAASDQTYRIKQIEERQGLNKEWFKFNSLPVLGHLWKVFSFICSPLLHLLEQQHWLLNSLESVSKFFWGTQAVSHVIIVGRRRPLITQSDPAASPPERQQKRRIWE